ncbi:histone-like nucleoid-structuring protein Lsr2 [Kineococcus radiotolerans]|nr:Lsr2 family protein [Kineococcus radiotolerans]
MAAPGRLSPCPTATRTTTQLSDNIDGSPATERLTFTLDGDAHEIDLNADHARQLRASLDVFIQHARRTGAQTIGHRDNCKRTTLAPDHRIIRSWARTHGHRVTATGRISPTLLRAYQAAQLTPAELSPRRQAPPTRPPRPPAPTGKGPRACEELTGRWQAASDETGDEISRPRASDAVIDTTAGGRDPWST